MAEPPAPTQLVPYEALQRINLGKLRDHPGNSNKMSEGGLSKLTANIKLTGAYPPLVVRPHPDLHGEYQILDGHQRGEVLRRLGHTDALCLVWSADDATATRLLATLNRLRGTEDQAKRRALLTNLGAMLPPEQLAQLLPESRSAIEKISSATSGAAAGLAAELKGVAEKDVRDVLRLISFRLSSAEAEVVELALKRAAAVLNGSNVHGQALVRIARRYLELGE